MILLCLGALTALMLARQSVQQPERPLAPAGAAVQAAAPPATTAPLSVQKVAGAREAIQQRLMNDYGVKCFTESESLFYRSKTAGADIDKQIAAKGLAGDGWVRDRLWVGSSETAAAAFGAMAAYADADSIWILVPGDPPSGVELYKITTPGGRTAWMPFDSVTACE